MRSPNHRTKPILVGLALFVAFTGGCQGSLDTSDPPTSASDDGDDSSALRRRRRADAGTIRADAGTIGADAGTIGTDASTRPDARSTPFDAGVFAPPDAPAPDAAAPTLADAATPMEGPITYELGTPPPGLTLHWPAPPVTTRSVRVTTLAQLASALTAGTTVTVAVSVERLEIASSDIALVVEPGVRIGHLFIHNRLSRISVRGGVYGDIEMQLPGTYWPAEEWHREWMPTDVLFDRVDVDAADTAFLLRGGVRIAITNSRSHAARYNVWIGDTADFESEDIIIAGNSLRSDGPEATIRLVHARRSAVVGNRLTNTLKHNYRIHGRSSDNWAARNVLVGTGMMLGTLPADLWPIERQTLENNTLYHVTPSLLELDPRLSPLVARGNHVYTNVWTCFVCVTPQPSWVLEGNVWEPYRAPPPE
jgi:hypothetical protein